MASLLLLLGGEMQKGQGTELGTNLESLSFEGGEAVAGNDPAILSCGGILLKRPEFPVHLERGHLILHTSAREISARIYQLAPDTSEKVFQDFMIRTCLN